MVHGSVREVQPGYSESQIAIWSMLFFLIPVTSKYVLNLIIRTNIRTSASYPGALIGFAHQSAWDEAVRTCTKSSCRSAIHNSAKETGHM
jgi:hypothetical protein